MELADAEGLTGPTMRAVAARLGAGTMSLYRHVAARAQLLELMVDLVAAEPDYSDTPDTQQAVLQTFARQWRGAMPRHPWLAAAMGSRTVSGPRALAWLEQTLARLGRPGMPMDRALDLIQTVTAFTVGFVEDEFIESQARRDTGLSEEQWRGTVAPCLLGALERGEHPCPARAVREAEDLPDAEATLSRRLRCAIGGLLRAPSGAGPPSFADGANGRPHLPERAERR